MKVDAFGRVLVVLRENEEWKVSEHGSEGHSVSAHGSTVIEGDQHARMTHTNRRAGDSAGIRAG